MKMTKTLAYPEFLSRGTGRCGEVGNRDDFTEEARNKNGQAARARAMAVCAPCRRRTACLMWALRTTQQGVYGMTTTSARSSAMRATKRDVARAALLLGGNPAEVSRASRSAR